MILKLTDAFKRGNLTYPFGSTGEVFIKSGLNGDKYLRSVLRVEDNAQLSIAI
jgi:hypothetical protein